MADFLHPVIDLVSEGIGNLSLKEDELAEDEDIDLSHTKIYDADLKNLLLEDIEDEITNVKDESLGAIDVCNILMERGVFGPQAQKRIRFLSLSLTSMNDETFQEVTDLLLQHNNGIKFVEKNGILDLSFNGLSPSSTPLIVRWIDEKHIRFINLHGNPACSMKNVRDLCKSMKDLKNANMEEVRRLMSHIVFLPEYYIYHASKQVKLYRQLHELGYVPDSWAEDQREYYRSISKERVSFPEEILNYDPDMDIDFIE